MCKLARGVKAKRCKTNRHKTRPCCASVLTTSQVSCYAKLQGTESKLKQHKNGTRINAELYNYSTEQKQEKCNRKCGSSGGVINRVESKSSNKFP